MRARLRASPLHRALSTRFRPLHIRQLQRLGRFDQAFGDGRRALQIPLAVLVAIIVEFSCERIERLIDLRLIRQRKSAAVRHHRDRGIFLRLLDMHVACFVVLGLRAVAFMLIDKPHIACVVVDREIVRIALSQDALVRLQARDVAVHGNAFSMGAGFLLMMVARADLLVLPRRAIGEQQGNVAGIVDPLLRLLIDAVDVGRCQSLEEGVLVVQAQDDVAAAFRADVSRDLHWARRRGRNDPAVVKLGIDEYRAVLISCDGGHVASLDDAAADGNSRTVRLDCTPHLRVDVHESLDIDLRTAHILARLDRTEVLARIFDADLDGMCRIIVILDHEFRLSMAAHMSCAEDAAPVKAALRIRLDIHALDVLDRERAAVDGDGIRRALPARIRPLPRQEPVSARPCLDVEPVSRHIDRALDVAVPVDRAELIVLR